MSSSEATHANATALARAAGLELSPDEMRPLADLYARYSGDRAALTAASLGEAEPATIFNAPKPDDGA
ncbi:MAG TPA: hypothetical protein VFV93_11910 [Thermomicrobiales bacterium]|nr:hypothetical protein [Thermomicrobiales bacterium]